MDQDDRLVPVIAQEREEVRRPSPVEVDVEVPVARVDVEGQASPSSHIGRDVEQPVSNGLGVVLGLRPPAAPPSLERAAGIGGGHGADVEPGSIRDDRLHRHRPGIVRSLLEPG